MQVSKDEILSQIRKIANSEGAVPGRERFEKMTGIKRHEWYGRYWARWGDALEEAGLSANSLQASFQKDTILNAYVGLVRKLGKIPSEGDIRIAKKTDPGFPSHSTLANHLGLQRQRLEKALEFVSSSTQETDMIELLKDAIARLPAESAARELSESLIASGDVLSRAGFVYLLKSGKFYKIGKTNSVDRRQYEIGLQLAEGVDPIHSIETDDPSGIEAYWHNRFKSKRLNGEWFDLDASDVRAFKLRKKFM